MPAVGYAIAPALFTALPARVEIETGNEEKRGQTQAGWESPNPNVLVCTDVDASALTGLFTRRVSEGPAASGEEVHA